MKARRTILWVASIGFGLVSTVGIIAVFGTTLAKFSLLNAILVFASTGSMAFIWLDLILVTRYLRS
jgi:hypothetical protein